MSQDNTIKIRLKSRGRHNAQIITGFLMLAENCANEYKIQFMNDIPSIDSSVRWAPPLVEVEFNGKLVAYDTSDGYYDGIASYVEKYDVYFKRSFSTEKNISILGEHLSSRVYPLGFNYFVTYKGNPYSETQTKTWKKYARTLLGRKDDSYFTPDKFEKYEKRNDRKRIIFMTRLWEPDLTLSDRINEERKYINDMRIEILVKLAEKYGELFVGGLTADLFSRRVAPEWILPPKLTRRENYLKLMQSCDITIGSMGLHESIGWKTGEYVAAGKAIVAERFRYEVPGNFFEQLNYLPYASANECIDAVAYLLDNPTAMLQMQERNRAYYAEYLRPDKMILRTLKHIQEL